ncbi:hypothetical protein FQN60_013105 [Etheostoma spectabile]|uniref:Uncharacterized protein n=1 Tax=Etheostoma spectabile TaxID=54343 RepID=A0A5J5DA82_9PERO|nr:hypothetical protein FQN60_013105 [Etheostoma spectabile]
MTQKLNVSVDVYAKSSSGRKLDLVKPGEGGREGEREVKQENETLTGEVNHSFMRGGSALLKEELVEVFAACCQDSFVCPVLLSFNQQGDVTELIADALLVERPAFPRPGEQARPGAVIGTAPALTLSTLSDVYFWEMVSQLPSFHDDVRLVDKFPPPAVLQHHLQLREVILAFQSALIEQSPVPHHVAGRRFADFPLGVAGRPRSVRLPFIGQIADDGQVAFLGRHVSAEPRSIVDFSEEEGPLRLVELQFVAVRVDLPEQTKWLQHNRNLRQHWRKHVLDIILHKRERYSNL